MGLLQLWCAYHQQPYVVAYAKISVIPAKIFILPHAKLYVLLLILFAISCQFLINLNKLSFTATTNNFIISLIWHNKNELLTFHAEYKLGGKLYTTLSFREPDWQRFHLDPWIQDQWGIKIRMWVDHILALWASFYMWHISLPITSQWPKKIMWLYLI